MLNNLYENMDIISKYMSYCRKDIKSLKNKEPRWKNLKLKITVSEIKNS